MSASLSDEQQKEVFKILVDTQDGGSPVSESRRQVASQFGLGLADVIQIERQGITNNWPPLDISFPAPEFLANDRAESNDTPGV